MKPFLTFLLSFVLVYPLFSQSEPSTALRVYQIFQNKCANCHSHDNPRGGLDLEGTGSSDAQKMLSVYDNLVGVQPTNTTAASKGYHLLSPGRVDQSFLFKKINGGLDRDIHLEEGEKELMPIGNSMTDVEKELVRQWILFGAPKESVVVKEALLKDYYENGKGRASFPDGGPAKPDPSEGFQIKMGPFFIDPAGEDEYFTKYNLGNLQEIEVNRLDIQMSNFSHHFIIYDYSSEASEVPEGFRLDQDHTADVSFVATVQESNDIALPKGTAFKWGKNHVLDLNSHTINYGADNVYQNEVYINVYTQPKGTAIQEMHAELIPYLWINIPNNGNEITHRDKVQYNAEAYLWNVTGHTHELGKSYKVWMNNQSGNADELIYDASCPRGIPGCVAPFYDYQHIPTRTFDDFLYVDFRKGLTHEAKWINDGPVPVRWGPTSKDEMMLFGILFVEDTTGLGNSLTTSTHFLEKEMEPIIAMPNPMKNYTNILLPNGIGPVQFQLFDMFGRELKNLSNYDNNIIRLEKSEFLSTSGMYLYTIKTSEGGVYTGKILLE